MTILNQTKFNPLASLSHLCKFPYPTFADQHWSKMSSTMDVQTQRLSTAIEKLMSNGINNLKVQDRYILPPHERPQMSQISHSENIPVIDLKDLNGPNRTTVIDEIRRACEEDGFFQVHTSIPTQQFSLPSNICTWVDFYYYQSCRLLSI